MTDKVRVHAMVLKGLEDIRTRGVEMNEYIDVLGHLYDRQHHMAVVWVARNKEEYFKGLEVGFEKL